MKAIAERTKLSRVIVPRDQHTDALLEMLELGVFVAMLAPIMSGRSTMLRLLRGRLEAEHPGSIFLLLRPDHSRELPREVFLADLLSKLRQQLRDYGLSLPNPGADPYLELKNSLAELPTRTEGLVVVAVDDLGHVESKHLKTLLWVFRELHSLRADAGWDGPLARLAVIVSGSKRLHELTVGQDDKFTSPFNIAELFFLPDFSDEELKSLLEAVHAERLIASLPKDESLRELLHWTGGHPSLIKEVLGELLELDLEPTGANIANAAQKFTSHDRTIASMWEKLQADSEAFSLVKEIFREGARPPANLEMVPDNVRVLYWLGWIKELQGEFAPRCKMAEEYVHSRLARLAASEGATNGSMPNGNAPNGSIFSEQPNSAVSPLSGRFAPTLFPDGLVSAFCNQAGVLFVGAGASAAAGLPTWSALSQGMADKILETAGDGQDRKNLEAYITSEDALAVAQLLKERLGPFDYFRFLTDFIRKPVSLSPLHHALSHLPAEIILTTNYDKLLERAFRPPGGDDPVVVVSTPQLAMVQEQQGPLVVKLHGDIDHPETIVLTSDDYLGYFDRHRAIKAFLEYQFNFRTILFVGFGLKDPNFDLIFDEARRLLANSGRPAYAIMVGTNPIEASRWKSRGIHIIDLPSFADIPVYVEDLAILARSGSAGHPGSL